MIIIMWSRYYYPDVQRRILRHRKVKRLLQCHRDRSLLSQDCDCQSVSFVLIMLLLYCQKRVCGFPVMSDSLRPHGPQAVRLFYPWKFPGKNAGVGCNFLLQGTFPTQGLIPCLLHLLPWQEDSLPLWHLESFVLSDVQHKCPLFRELVFNLHGVFSNFPKKKKTTVVYSVCSIPLNSITLFSYVVRSVIYLSLI